MVLESINLVKVMGIMAKAKRVHYHIFPAFFIFVLFGIPLLLDQISMEDMAHLSAREDYPTGYCFDANLFYTDKPSCVTKISENIYGNGIIYEVKNDVFTQSVISRMIKF